MPSVDAQKIFTAIQKSASENAFAPIYFFYGEESYLIQKALAYILDLSLEPFSRDFNFTSYYASDADLQKVVEDIQTLPMMAPRRVVVLKETQSLNDKDWAELQAVIEDPAETTLFVITANKIDKRKKIFKTLFDKSVYVEFKKPFENQVLGWIKQIVGNYNLTISDEAGYTLQQAVGNDLVQVDLEIQKMQDYLKDRTHIEKSDVEASVPKQKQENVFDLMNSIAMGDKVMSLTQLVNLLDEGQNELGIVALLARHMRILIQAKRGLDEGFAGDSLARRINVPSFFLKDYLRQVQQWSVKDLEKVMLILADTDRALKSSPLSSHIWLENLVLKSCELRKDGSNRKVL